MPPSAQVSGSSGAPVSALTRSHSSTSPARTPGGREARALTPGATSRASPPITRRHLKSSPNSIIRARIRGSAAHDQGQAGSVW